MRKLVGTSGFDNGYQGWSVALSGAGDVLAVGGPGDFSDVDNTFRGAVWIFVQKNGAWSQQGNKLVGSGAVGPTLQGGSVALSSVGDVLAFGGSADNSGTGAVWIFAQKNGQWTQQGNKLVGSAASGEQLQG